MFAEVNAQRYVERKDLNIVKRVPYSEATKIGRKKPSTLYFDFYKPKTDTAQLRPLVITLFGGGFVAGSRHYADMRAFCKSLARKGFVAASIDYRCMKLYRLSSKNLIRCGYMASQDLSAAIRYFKAHSEEYGIDTTAIFLLGNSAGSVAALHEIFMDEDERPAETFEKPELGTLHSENAMYGSHTTDVAGAIMQWGCIFDPEMIDADELTPICLIHGTRDSILPCDSGYSFKRKRLPYVYGSQAIASRFDELGNTNYEFHRFEGKKHVFYFDVFYILKLNRKELDTCLQIALDFIDKNMKVQ